MRDLETIILWLTWGIALVALVISMLIVFNLNLFPPKKLKNLRFSEIEIGQVFYDFGGEETKLCKYVKTGEFEAKCLSIFGRPTVGFDEIDIVKVEVLRG